MTPAKMPTFRIAVSVAGPQTVSGFGAVAFGLLVQRVFLVDFHQVTRFSISMAICLVTCLALVVGVFRVTRPLQLALSVLRDLGPMRAREILTLLTSKQGI